tara:strand:+ start:239 stop:397 length:159 start_codon:yes stop_codon:yes gene_type:complete
MGFLPFTDTYRDILLLLLLLLLLLFIELKIIKTVLNPVIIPLNILKIVVINA